MKFCPNFVTFAQIMILEYISDMTKNQFCPKIMVISKKKKKKKKRSSLKFSLPIFDFRPKIKVFSKKKKKVLAVPHHLSKFPDFAQFFHIAARKTMVLPKYFLLTARKILILPKSSKLGGAIAPPAPPAGTAMIVELLLLASY